MCACVFGAVFQDGGEVVRLRLLALLEAGISFKVSSVQYYNTGFFFILNMCHMSCVFSLTCHVPSRRKEDK